MAHIQYFDDFFEVEISKDYLEARLHLLKGNYDNLAFTKEDLLKELKEHKIVFGIDEDMAEKIAAGLKKQEFPVTIAKGIPPKHGEDGKIIFDKDLNTSALADQHDKDRVNFREVMKIPSTKKGEKLATIVPPKPGEPGKNIFGKPLPPKKGKKPLLRAGKNTELNIEENSIYATDDGQVHLLGNNISVVPVYEVNGDLDMKTGNLDFIGSIVIRGNVPTGFTIQAKGDIRVYGLVEAATLKAGGSIFISEGVAGLKKGKIKAGLDVHAGYINQGTIEAGRDIFVENSILHSECMAKDSIYCQKGNIIGGSVSAGKQIEAKDIGNRLSTKTLLFIGNNKKTQTKLNELEKKRDELNESIQKLKILGSKLVEKQQHSSLSEKERLLLIRQRHSMKTALTELNEVEDELAKMKDEQVSTKHNKVNVQGILYPNVEFIHGKYHRRIYKQYQHVTVRFEEHDVRITTL
ncbi:MAG: DUF342 domain-containing protein [Bacillaceae bacterium]|nr:DUF342 domain-containing protein [Bacillaceae bacterium]